MVLPISFQLLSLDLSLPPFTFSKDQRSPYPAVNITIVTIPTKHVPFIPSLQLIFVLPMLIVILNSLIIMK